MTSVSLFDITCNILNSSVPCSFVRLWGESFFNPKTKKWAKSKDDDNKRSFCMYVLDPIYKMFDVIMNYKKEETASLLLKLNIDLKHEDKEKDGKPLLKVGVLASVTQLNT